jgi:predicted metal-dependent peptidase
VDPNETLVAMPRDEKGDIVGLYDSKYEGWTVLQIFRDLQQQKQDGGEEGEGDPTQEKGNVSGSGGGGFDDHDWDSAGQMSAEEVSRLEGDIKQAIRQGQMAAKRAGLGSGKDTFELSEMLKSRVDWRAQLRDFMNSTCADKQESSWRRPNRRFLYNDVIMPTLIGESIKEVVFARDASGSMYYRNRLVAVTSEMLAIIAALSIDRIHLLDWDGAVNERGVYSSESMKTAPEVQHVVGGGGTDPRCVEAYLKAKNIKPDAIIMLTDGEVPAWGTWDVPVLWVIANDNKITAPVGKTINVEEV